MDRVESRSPIGEPAGRAARRSADLADPGGDAERDASAPRGGPQRLPEIDREVIALRHFEHLTNSETARVLGGDR